MLDQIETQPYSNAPSCIGLPPIALQTVTAGVGLRRHTDLAAEDATGR